MSPQIWAPGYHGQPGSKCESNEVGRTYLDRSLKLEKDGLRNEDLTGLSAKVSDFSLKKLDLLAGSAASNFEEPIDYRVEIDLMLVCHLNEPSEEIMARRSRDGRGRVGKSRETGRCANGAAAGE